jgi:hypothetical protein
MSPMLARKKSARILEEEVNLLSGQKNRSQLIRCSSSTIIWLMHDDLADYFSDLAILLVTGLIQ